MKDVIEIHFGEEQHCVTAVGLTEWDYGMKLHIHGLDVEGIQQVHFADKSVDEAITRLATNTNGYLEVAVPDKLLENTYDITAFVYIVGGDYGRTIKKIILPVSARKKPDELEIPDDPDLKTELQEFIEQLNGDVEEMKDVQISNNEDNVKFQQEMNNLINQKFNIGDLSSNVYLTKEVDETDIPFGDITYNKLSKIDVYLNGMHLNTEEYTIDEANRIVKLVDPVARVGTEVQIISLTSVIVNDADLATLKGETGEGFSIYKTYTTITAMNDDKDNVPEGKFVMIASDTEDVDNAKLYVKNASGTFTFLTDMSGAQGMKGDKGEVGQSGSDGYSPIAKVTKAGDTSTFTVTDKIGTTNVNIDDGEDGYSPTISTSKTGKITTVTVTDVNGTQSFEVRDGSDGSGIGDMLKATYDTNDSGIVDDAEKVNGLTVETAVPSNAVFTDTVYDDTDIRGLIANNLNGLNSLGNVVNNKANSKDVYTKTVADSTFATKTALAEKQNTLTAGNNITITGDTISATKMNIKSMTNNCSIWTPLNTYGGLAYCKTSVDLGTSDSNVTITASLSEDITDDEYNDAIGAGLQLKTATNTSGTTWELIYIARIKKPTKIIKFKVVSLW